MLHQVRSSFNSKCKPTLPQGGLTLWYDALVAEWFEFEEYENTYGDKLGDGIDICENSAQDMPLKRVDVDAILEEVEVKLQFSLFFNWLVCYGVKMIKIKG